MAWLDLFNNLLTGPVPAEWASNAGLGRRLLNYTVTIGDTAMICTGLVLAGNALSGPLPDGLVR